MLWKRNDVPGHEFVRMSGNTLDGVAIFEYDGVACRLDYAITCDAAWTTRVAEVSGWIGDREMHAIVRAEHGVWTLDGVQQPQVAGCIDVDLNFSPSTNLLPVRRLNLAIGEAADVAAAWLRFPSFTLERLEQTYTRTGERTYRYASRTGFVAEIVVDEAGLPISYGDIWS